MAKIGRNDHILFALSAICINNILNENTVFGKSQGPAVPFFQIQQSYMTCKRETVKMTLMAFPVLKGPSLINCSDLVFSTLTPLLSYSKQHHHNILNLLSLTPFIPYKHGAASMQGVLISLTISVEIPPEDGSFLSGEKKHKSLSEI